MKRRSLCPLLVCLLVAGGGAASELVLPPESAAFRVVAFNAEWLFDGRNDTVGSCGHCSSPAAADEHLNAIAVVLGALAPDYVSLAEVEDAAVLARLNVLLGGSYHEIFVEGTDTATGQDVAALSRLAPTRSPSRTSERAAYPVPGSRLACGAGSQGVSKNYVAELDLGGIPVTLIGVHFLAYPDRCDRSIQREAQASVIAKAARAALARGNEVVVLGDVNDFDSAAPDAAGNRPTSRVLDLLKDLVPEAAGDELVNVCATLPQAERFTDWYDRDDDGLDDGAAEHSQIDYVLVSRGLADRVRYVAIAHTTPAGVVSDHWPIVVDFTLASEASDATPTPTPTPSP